MEWIRHYAGHYYLFWGVIFTAIVFCLLGIWRELRRLRDIFKMGEIR